MSHAATNWLAKIPPQDMTPGEFRVMFHLCDCHNPSHGCFPGQEYLRDNTGLSNGGLNKALSSLEDKGFICRNRTRDEKTKRQKETRYILGFEMDDAQKPSPLSGDGAVSTQGVDPSPLSASTRLHSSGVIYKDKPVKEPVKEPCADAHNDFDFDEFLEAFIRVYPRGQDREKVLDHLKSAIEQGADPKLIMHGARHYAQQQAGNKTQYIALPSTWIEGNRWKDHAPPPDRSENADLKRATIQAQSIIKQERFAISSLSAARVRELISLELVTESQCIAAGVDL